MSDTQQQVLIKLIDLLINGDRKFFLSTIMTQLQKGSTFWKQVFHPKFIRWLKKLAKNPGYAIRLFKGDVTRKKKFNPDLLSGNEKSYKHFIEMFKEALKQASIMKRRSPAEIVQDILNILENNPMQSQTPQVPKTMQGIPVRPKVLRRSVPPVHHSFIQEKVYHITIDFNDRDPKTAVRRIHLISLGTKDGYVWLNCHVDGREKVYHITLQVPEGGKAGDIHGFRHEETEVTPFESSPFWALEVPLLLRKMGGGITTDHIALGFDFDGVLGPEPQEKLLDQWRDEHSEDLHGWVRSPDFLRWSFQMALLEGSEEVDGPLRRFVAAVNSFPELNIFTSRRFLKEKELPGEFATFLKEMARSILPDETIVNFSMQASPNKKTPKGVDKEAQGVDKGIRLKKASPNARNRVFLEDHPESVNGAAKEGVTALQVYPDTDIPSVHVLPEAKETAPRINISGPVGSGKDAIVSSLNKVMVDAKVLSTDAMNAEGIHNSYGVIDETLRNNPDTPYIVNTGGTSGLPSEVNYPFTLSPGNAPELALCIAILGVLARSTNRDLVEDPKTLTLPIHGFSDEFKELLRQYALFGAKKEAPDDGGEKDSYQLLFDREEKKYAPPCSDPLPSYKDGIKKMEEALSGESSPPPPGGDRDWTMSFMEFISQYPATMDGFQRLKRDMDLRGHIVTGPGKFVQPEDGGIIEAKIMYKHSGAKDYSTNATQQMRGAIIRADLDDPSQGWWIESVIMAVGPEAVLFADGKGIQTEDDEAKFTPSMVERLNRLAGKGFDGTGLTAFVTQKGDGQNFRMVVRPWVEVEVPDPDGGDGTKTVSSKKLAGYTKIGDYGFRFGTNNSGFVEPRIQGAAAQAARDEMKRLGFEYPEINPEVMSQEEAFKFYMEEFIKHVFIPDMIRILASDEAGPGEIGKTFTFEIITEGAKTLWDKNPQTGLAVRYGKNFFVFTGMNDHVEHDFGKDGRWSGQFYPSAIFADTVKRLPWTPHFVTPNPRELVDKFSRIVTDTLDRDELLANLDDFGKQHGFRCCNAYKDLTGLDKWHLEGFAVFVTRGGEIPEDVSTLDYHSSIMIDYFKAKLKAYYVAHKDTLKDLHPEKLPELAKYKHLSDVFHLVAQLDAIEKVNVEDLRQAVIQVFGKAFDGIIKSGELRKRVSEKALPACMERPKTVLLNQKGVASCSSDDGIEKRWLIARMISRAGSRERLTEEVTFTDAELLRSTNFDKCMGELLGRVGVSSTRSKIAAEDLKRAKEALEEWEESFVVMSPLRRVFETGGNDGQAAVTRLMLYFIKHAPEKVTEEDIREHSLTGTKSVQRGIIRDFYRVMGEH